MNIIDKLNRWFEKNNTPLKVNFSYSEFEDEVPRVKEYESTVPCLICKHESKKMLFIPNMTVEGSTWPEEGHICLDLKACRDRVMNVIEDIRAKRAAVMKELEDQIKFPEEDHDVNNNNN
jgi:hypothetical protein